MTPTSGTTAGLALGDTAPSYELPDTDGRDVVADRRPRRRRPPSSCSPATTAPTRWHGTIGSAMPRESTRAGACGSSRSTPTMASRYPRDSYEAMQRRVAAEDWPMPYLHDAQQEVARAFGAKTTPDLFVLDAAGVLRYRGAPDADHDDPSLRAQWLRDALDAVLAGAAPDRASTQAGRVLDQVEAVAR